MKIVFARKTRKTILISGFVVVCFGAIRESAAGIWDFLSQFAEQKGQKRNARIKRYMYAKRTNGSKVSKLFRQNANRAEKMHSPFGKRGHIV